MESGISKYLGEDISGLGRGKIRLLLFALEVLNFLKLVSVTFINRRGKSVTYLLSIGIEKEKIHNDTGQLQF